jgi:ATP-dependent DNA helicase RecG
MVGRTIFVRRGGLTAQATADDLHELIANRTRFELNWEQQPAVGLSLDDLDAQEIYRTARAARTDEPVVPLDDTRSALRTFNLLVEEPPTQAAVVAFARQPLPWYPQCTLRLARFRGLTKVEFVDQERVNGHAFSLLQRADQFIRKHIPIAGTFVPGKLERQDKPLYPPLALREALVNALCHRDYSIAGGSVSVAIFDDRLEVASTGGLPDGLTANDLTRDHPSIPRNPLLAQLFYQRGLIELWGRGTLNIIAQCEAEGGVAPAFECRGGETIVRFFAPGTVRTVPGLSDRQNRLLSALAQAPRMALRELRATVAADQSDQTIRNDLIHLRDLGLVESQGHGRGASWRLARIAPQGE